MKKQTGQMLEWVYRIFMSCTLFFTLALLIEGSFFYRYTFFSRQFWESYWPVIGIMGLASIALYYLLLWFYPPSRPWWDRLGFIVLVFTLFLFNPLAKG